MNHHDAFSADPTATQLAEPAPPPARRVRRTPEQKAELLARFEASGLKVAGFCRREGLSPASFYLWRRDAGSTTEQTPARLLRVQTPEASRWPPATEAHRVTARLRNGVELGVGVEHLDAFVKAVASC